MAKKLPEVITKEDFNKILEESKKERESYRGKRNKKLKSRGRRINEYMIAMILGCHAGMRISEIIGLRPEGSKCCRVPLIEENKKINGRTRKIKICSSCKKEWKSHEVLRLNEGWDIKPLTKDKIKPDRIFISQGKGEKDRWTWKPKLINQEALNYLPLKVSRRSVQDYFEYITLKVLGKKLNFHVLRHTFATEYLKANPGDLRTLQILLGHSRIDTTTIYTHISVEDALKKVQDIF